MWRKLLRNWVQDSLLGNTSTYVEKTVWCKKHPKRNGKHLHVCGENLRPLPLKYPLMETPPRMWRKPAASFSPNRSDRNTSTYVEKTAHQHSISSMEQKHLHVCGENRGINQGFKVFAGNTSTYVEKTGRVAVQTDRA